MLTLNDFSEPHCKTFKVEKLYILPFNLTVGSSLATGPLLFIWWACLAVSVLYEVLYFDMKIILLKITTFGLHS